MSKTEAKTQGTAICEELRAAIATYIAAGRVGLRQSKRQGHWVIQVDGLDAGLPGLPTREKALKSVRRDVLSWVASEKEPDPGRMGVTIYSTICSLRTRQPWTPGTPSACRALAVAGERTGWGCTLTDADVAWRRQRRAAALQQAEQEVLRWRETVVRDGKQRESQAVRLRRHPRWPLLVALWRLDKRQPVKGLGAAVRDYVPSPAEEAAIRAIVDAIQAKRKIRAERRREPFLPSIVCIRRQLAKRREGQIKATFASWCRHVEAHVSVADDPANAASINYVWRWNDRRSYQRRHGYSAGGYDVLQISCPSSALPTLSPDGREAAVGCWRYRHHQDLRIHRLQVRYVPQGEEADRKAFAAETNQERRRAIIAACGENVVAMDKAELVQADDYGRLYRLPDGLFVRVACHSTGAPYWLSVPDTCRSAHEAVAATFGMRAVDYCPTIQS